MNPALDDELTSINSIYEPDTLSILDEHISTSTPSAAPTLCALRLPALRSISLRLEFPPTYPDAPPSILGTQSVGDDVAKGDGLRVVAVARTVLARIYQPGEPCVFDLVEELGEAVVRERAEAAGHGRSSTTTTNNNSPPAATDAGVGAHEDGETEAEDGSQDRRAKATSAETLGPEPLWVLSEPVTEKKSVFLGRAAAVRSPAEAQRYVRHLLATDKKAAKASHNMTAWRIRGEHGATYQDCDDDGETAAGGRLLHLMQLMDVWDVMVVVSRWYGGVQLGPDRFRIINSVARDALVRSGVVPEESQKKKGKK